MSKRKLHRRHQRARDSQQKQKWKNSKQKHQIMNNYSDSGYEKPHKLIKHCVKKDRQLSWLSNSIIFEWKVRSKAENSSKKRLKAKHFHAKRQLIYSASLVQCGFRYFLIAMGFWLLFCRTQLWFRSHTLLWSHKPIFVLFLVQHWWWLRCAFVTACASACNMNCEFYCPCRSIFHNKYFQVLPHQEMNKQKRKRTVYRIMY